MVRIVRLAWLVTCLAVVAPTVSAQTPPQSAADQEARALFEAGRIAFDNGRYTQALDMFQRSYELSQRVGLLYNIGSTLDRLRHDREALDAFQRFLAGDPTTARRAEVEGRIAILQEQVAAADAIAPRNVAATQEPPETTSPDAALSSDRAERTPITRRWWFWTVIGVVVVGTAVGIGVGVSDPGTQGPATVDPNTMIIRL